MLSAGHFAAAGVARLRLGQRSRTRVLLPAELGQDLANYHSCLRLNMLVLLPAELGQDLANYHSGPRVPVDCSLFRFDLPA